MQSVSVHRRLSVWFVSVSVVSVCVVFVSVVFSIRSMIDKRLLVQLLRPLVMGGNSLPQHVRRAAVFVSVSKFVVTLVYTDVSTRERVRNRKHTTPHHCTAQRDERPLPQSVRTECLGPPQQCIDIACFGGGGRRYDIEEDKASWSWTW